jgi:hypothetical protein
VLEVVIPADIIEGCEFVATGSLDTALGAEGTVQLQVLTVEARAIVQSRGRFCNDQRWQVHMV